MMLDELRFETHTYVLSENAEGVITSWLDRCIGKCRYIVAVAAQMVSKLYETATTGGKGEAASGEKAYRSYLEISNVLDDYGDAMLRLAYTYVHNMMDAEDILQDALIKYMQTNVEFDSDAHEKAWLLRVTANLSKNRIVYNRIREADEIDDELIAEQREDLSYVWEAVKELPVIYREVIHLYYHEGFSVKEIADILDMNESTIRSNLKRGREKLRLVLKEEYDFE